LTSFYNKENRKMFAIVSKKERWRLTTFGNLLKFLILTIIILIYAKCIHPFLSYNDPINSNVMVVEGFIPDHALKQAYEIFTRDNYNLMIITGKRREKGAQLDSFGNDGNYSAAILKKMGMNGQLIKVVTMDFEIKKDRTFATAVAVKNWINESGKGIDSFNVISIGCHSRRSQLLFEKAFDDDTKIGIISADNPTYDHEKWWSSSLGFREVMQETIAYTYARLFFFP